MKLYLHIIIYILFISIAITGCKKDTEIYPDSPAVPVVIDTIIYTEVNNICISYDTSSCLQYYQFDLDQDGIMDYEIKASRFIIINYGEGHEVMINAIDSTFSQGHKVTWCYKISNQYLLLDNNFTLTDTASYWYSGMGLSLWVPYPPYGYVYDSGISKYIGLRLVKQNQNYLGWLEIDWNKTDTIIQIKSFAVNKYPSVPIRTGQIN